MTSLHPEAGPEPPPRPDVPAAATTGGQQWSVDVPAQPRRWFGAPPDTPTIAFCLVSAVLIAGPGFLWLRLAVRALLADKYLLAFGAGLLTLLAFSLAAVILVPIINPRPRIMRSAEGLSISPAWVVSIGLIAVGILLMVVLVMLGAAVVRGDILADSRRALGIPGLAVFTIVLLVPFMARAVVTRLRRGKAGYLVSLTPAGIQFSDMGRLRQVAWDQITDIRVGRRGRQQVIGSSELCLYTTAGGENVPLMVDRWLQMGGAWLADTIRYYWQHPGARSHLGDGPEPAPNRSVSITPPAAHSWPQVDQLERSTPAPAAESRRRRRVLALVAAVLAVAAALGLFLDRPEPPLDNEFANGGSITLVLAKPESRDIYVAHERQKPVCEVSSPDPGANAVIQDKGRGGRRTGPVVPRDESENDSFVAFRDFHARKAGAYAITCSANPGAVFRLEGPTRPVDVMLGVLISIGSIALMRLGYLSWRRRRGIGGPR